jgi:hypothetical protein
MEKLTLLKIASKNVLRAQGIRAALKAGLLLLWFSFSDLYTFRI